jgi:DNA primase
LLQCLISQPALGVQVHADWHGEGAEAEAVIAVLYVLREAGFEVNGAALMQMLQGTVHEKALAAAEADMLNWGDNFDVAAEFAGLIDRLNEGQRRQQFQALQARLAQGGLPSLSEEEREQYKQLAKPPQRG